MARVDGSENLALPRERVWALLNDPGTLGAAIPGCRGLEREEGEEHRYRTAIAVAIGAVKGVYEGTVLYADVEEPERCTIKVSGRGDKGTIDGQGEIELREAGDGTEVAYRGEFKLTGPVAGIGQRLAPGVSRKMIVETLRNLEAAGEATPGPSPEEATPEPAGSDRPPALRSSAGRHRPAPAPDSAGESHRTAPVTASAGGDPSTPVGESGAGDSRPAPASEVEAFNPVPAWARTVGVLVVGVLIGFVIGRIV
ncbi:MAG TPA: SRPBCC domain-containing protein [Solirubrobacterales bacterium]|nr:SRPBCC domain-containing protein [Solirubrobacterales bacterium]